MATSNLYEVEIFLAGTRPASNGVSTTITPEYLQEVVDSYNPEAFRAPLIVSGNLGHDIGNYTDKTVSKSKELCHGIPSSLRRVGDRLYAGFEKISRDFAQWVRDKQIHSFSSSFYLPNSPNNPYPGKWSLRHIAGLGTTPPACKGLAPPPEPPSDWCEAGEFESYAINFQDNEEGVISFGMYVSSPQSPWVITADLFQLLRENMIDSEDLETANRVLPADQIAALRDAATRDAMKDQQILQLQMQVAQLQQDADDDDDDDDDDPSVGYEENEMTDYKAILKKSGMTLAEVAKESGLTPQEVSDICQSGKVPNAKQKKALDKVFASDSDSDEDDSTDMSEELEQKAADLAAREEALTNRERALEHQEVSSFVEGLVKEGKLVSGRREDTITLLLNTPNTTEIEFSESLGKKTPRQALMTDYASRKAWNFSEDIVVRETAPSPASFSAPAGYSVDGDSNKIYIKAIAYCESHKLDRNNQTDWNQALEASMR
ncbi:MAG: helix-turn-helix transcriptional regulator [Nostoc sp. NMS7]|uniref:helix-turn-helix domain-containing protein n=1 Tax=Nostoc sp. NMS7 TaxID=2815391 RepID=UPI0025F7CE49|nr:helix-turn-helix transcriptional regulator [Nostoc sp. NMS7]MBN3949359.1 helix-turn-helix transcriptional regulator [Nostoc sp. NMS7]